MENKVMDPIELLSSDPAEQYVLKMKSKIGVEIVKAVRENYKTRADAAKVIGVSLPRLSVMMSRPFGISLDTLVKSAHKLGVELK